MSRACGIGGDYLVHKHCGRSSLFTFMLGSRLGRLGVWGKDTGDIPGCCALLGSWALLLRWRLFSNRFLPSSSMNIDLIFTFDHTNALQSEQVWCSACTT